MDFDEFFGKKNKHQKEQMMQNYHRGNSFSHKSSPEDYESFNPIEFINSIKRSKKLKVFFLIVLLLLIAIVIGFIAILFPTIKAIINYISQNGFSGVFDMVIEFLNKLWNGTK